MITFLGWAVFILGGAYAAFAIGVLIYGTRGGGLEAVPGMLISGSIFAISWLAFAVWLSPITIAVN